MNIDRFICEVRAILAHIPHELTEAVRHGIWATRLWCAEKIDTRWHHLVPIFIVSNTYYWAVVQWNKDCCKRTTEFEFATRKMQNVSFYKSFKKKERQNIESQEVNNATTPLNCYGCEENQENWDVPVVAVDEFVRKFNHIDAHSVGPKISAWPALPIQVHSKWGTRAYIFNKTDCVSVPVLWHHGTEPFLAQVVLHPLQKAWSFANEIVMHQFVHPPGEKQRQPRVVNKLNVPVIPRRCNYGLKRTTKNFLNNGH